MADTAAARATLIERATRARLGDEALARYTERVEQLSDTELRRLDPATFRGPAAAQPDQTTCGSSSLVMSRMVNDPAYAMYVATGHDPVTGVSDPGTGAQRFARESLAMHERTNAGADRDGDRQLPWPRWLGTQPWALANEMSAAGGSGVPGTTYRVHAVRLKDRTSSFEAIIAANRAGHTVPVYVGSRLRPAHVVLVTASDGESLTFYQPGGGRTVHVTRDQWRRDQFTGALGWSRPWAIVVPRGVVRSA